jgi:RNA recognition motif-containing protein
LKIYVGNLPWSIDDRGLEDLFASHGTIDSAQVVQDRDSGRSRGFGFVEMNREDGVRAIEALNGKEVDSRELKVNEAQAKEKRASNY